MVNKQYRMLWLCLLMIVAVAGCDSTDGTDNPDTSKYQITIAADPATLLISEFSSITATVNNVDTSVATGTSTTTTTPVVGYPVTFTIIQNATNCSITVVNGLTDGSGNAIALYRAGSSAGIDVIQARIENGQSTSVSVIVNLPTTQ